jgi:hypothetical protein
VVAQRRAKHCRTEGNGSAARIGSGLHAKDEVRLPIVLVHRVLLMSGLSIGLMGMVRFPSEIVVSTKIISLDIRNSEVSTKNGWLTEGSSVILDNVETVSSNFDYPNQSIRVFPGFLGDEGISLVVLRAFDLGAFGL